MQTSKKAQFEELYYPYTASELPLMYLTAEEQKRINAISGDLNGYVNGMDRAFVTGGESLDNFDEYTRQIIGLGAEELIGIYQAAYERWKSN
jgi:putative aldouronate transport system substrate-binding protein